MKTLIIFSFLFSTSLQVSAGELTKTSSSHNDNLSGEAQKLDKEVKKDIAHTKKVVNSEVCDSGQEQCSFTPKASTTKTSTKIETKKSEAGH